MITYVIMERNRVARLSYLPVIRYPDSEFTPSCTPGIPPGIAPKVTFLAARMTVIQVAILVTYMVTSPVTSLTASLVTWTALRLVVRPAGAVTAARATIPTTIRANLGSQYPLR